MAVPVSSSKVPPPLRPEAVLAGPVVVLAPHAVHVIGHQVEVVEVLLHVLGFVAAKIPVAGRDGYRSFPPGAFSPKHPNTDVDIQLLLEPRRGP